MDVNFTPVSEEAEGAVQLIRKNGQPVYSNIPIRGMVAETLSADGVPTCIYDQTVAADSVPADVRQLTNCSMFHTWFTDTAAVALPSINEAVFGPYPTINGVSYNVPFEAGTPVPRHSGNTRVDDSLLLTYDGSMFVFENSEFFPLKGCAFNDVVGASLWCTNNIGDEKSGSSMAMGYTDYFNTYLFTTEVRLQFLFKVGCCRPPPSAAGLRRPASARGRRPLHSPWRATPPDAFPTRRVTRLLPSRAMTTCGSSSTTSSCSTSAAFTLR